MELQGIAESPLDHPPLLIAVDGGGTRTQCAIYTLDGTALAETEGGPSNHLSAGRPRALQSLREVLTKGLALSNSRMEDVRLLSAGFAGVDADGAGSAEMTELVAEAGYDRVLINGDMVTAQAGAFNGKPGVLAVAGTGAVFFGVSESGERSKTGGYGYCFGDEGGGYWIAVEALRAASRAQDGRGESTALVGLLCRAFDVAAFPQIPTVLYASPIRPAELARLSLLVEKAASQGDQVASRILRRAGHELAVGTVSVARRLRWGSGCPVSYQGSILRKCPLVLQTFQQEVRERLPDVEIQPPLFEALYGAYLLGLREIQRSKTEQGDQ